VALEVLPVTVVVAQVHRALAVMLELHIPVVAVAVVALRNLVTVADMVVLAVQVL
jgi:hypothetical protein